MERARAYKEYRSVIFRLFITENLTREQAKFEFERQELEQRLTFDQWKILLSNLGIFKKIRGEDAIRAKRLLVQAPDGYYCLVFADDVLQDNEDIIQHCCRRRTLPKERSDPRKLTCISFPFKIATLDNPDAFKNFQFLLFNTRIHFESCFDSGEWAPNHKGLYARSTELRAQLADLSKLHNTVFRALKQLKNGGNRRAETLLKYAFAFHRSVVGYRHHRQLPDILGILLMVGRAGNRELQHSIRKDLVSLARQILSKNDPRRLIFECLEKLALDQLRTLYLAYDTYCRSLWMERAGNDLVRAYFSYNQARFPRADAGEFFSLYKGKTMIGIEDILARVDVELGLCTHETMTLWQTAIEYLWSERRYVEMGYFCQCLSERVRRLVTGFDSQDPQLNHDVSITFLLLGLAQEAQGCYYSARLSFKQAAQIRDHVVSGDKWDPARESALGKLVEVDRRIGEIYTANYSSMLIDKMYS